MHNVKKRDKNKDMFVGPWYNQHLLLHITSFEQMQMIYSDTVPISF